jgi:hypothetical protein
LYGLSGYELGVERSTSSRNVKTSVVAHGKEATLYPTSDIAVGFPVVYPATPTTHYDKVDDVTPDDASTYIRTGDSTTEVVDRYGKPSFTLPAGKKIAFIRLVCRGLCDSSGAKFRFGLYIGTAYYWSGYKNPTAWTTYTQDWMRNPATGKGWTQDDINNLQIAVAGVSYLSGTTYYYARITQVYLEIYTYTDVVVSYAIELSKWDSSGNETLLTDKVAAWTGYLSSIYDSAGLKSAVYSLTEQKLLASTDLLVIRVYARVGAGSWTLVAVFLTDVLAAKSVDPSTWTAYYYLDVTYDTSYVYTLYYWGTSTYDSRLEGFAFAFADNNRFFRRDTWTVNGLTAYQLGTENSTTYTTKNVARIYTYAGIRVWKRSTSGTETEITAGKCVAVVSYGATLDLHVGTWNNPDIPLSQGDALIVRVYDCDYDGSCGSLLDTWISEQLNAGKIQAGTWTVYYWLQYIIIETTEYLQLNLGSITYNSHIDGVAWTPAPVGVPRFIGDGLAGAVVIV